MNTVNQQLETRAFFYAAIENNECWEVSCGNCLRYELNIIKYDKLVLSKKIIFIFFL